MPRSATLDLVYWRLVGWPWGAFTDRGPWAMFLGNVSRLRHMEHGLGVTAPKTHVPRAKANRPVLLVECARSTRGGLRVGMVDSFGWGFVWVAKLRIAELAT